MHWAGKDLCFLSSLVRFRFLWDDELTTVLKDSMVILLKLVKLISNVFRFANLDKFLKPVGKDFQAKLYFRSC